MLYFLPTLCASASKSVHVISAAFAFFICLTFALPNNAATLTVSADETAKPSVETLQKQMEAVKAQMEKPKTNLSFLANRYSLLLGLISECQPANNSTEPTVNILFSPTANVCVNGALALSDPDFNRPLASSIGTGIGNGTVGNCSLSGTATAANYDVYAFNVTGCVAFPTEVTATLCGPAGCQQVGNVDTTLILYRNVPAGDPLTANGGLPNVFNPSSPCTNARAGQDDLGTTSGTTNNSGGATCNQINTADCVAPCTSPSNAGALSGLRRNVGSGQFTTVVAGFGNTTVGGYNLYVDAPGAGCVVTRVSPTAAGVSIAGRVITPQELGLTNALVTLTDPQGNSQTFQTGKFGSFRFSGLAAGETYVISVTSKRYTYTPQVIMANEDVTNVNFTAQ